MAVLLLLAVLAVRYAHVLVYPDVLNDEISYVRAARLVVAGESPYYGGYLYPPLVAVAVAEGEARWGLLPTLVALRLANFLGVAVTAWLAVLPLPGSWRLRWLAAAACLALAPAVRFTLEFSNLSAVVVGAITAALALWPTAPWTAGVLLGTSLAVKPLAPGALAVLLAHRPAAGGRRHLVAVAVALLAAALWLLPLPYLGDMATVPASSSHLLLRTVSPHRLAALLGWRHNLLPLSAALLALALWWTRRRRRGPQEVAVLAAVTAIAVTPVVWSHSLLLTLPLQTLALERAWRRWSVGGPRRPALAYEGVFVLLAVAAIQFAEGAQGVYDRGLALQLAAALPPAVAPAALAAYVLAGSLPRPGLPSGAAASQMR